MILPNRDIQVVCGDPGDQIILERVQRINFVSLNMYHKVKFETLRNSDISILTLKSVVV